MGSRVLLLTAVAALLVAPSAAADPVGPQPGTPCSLDGVSTMPPGESMPLLCDGQRWHAATAPGDPSDRWVSFDAPMALHGQGLRNPNLLGGVWTATPLDPAARCRATQQAVISAGVVGDPVDSEGQPGQPLSLQVSSTLFDITMSGHCLWERKP